MTKDEIEEWKWRALTAVMEEIALMTAWAPSLKCAEFALGEFELVRRLRLRVERRRKRRARRR